MINLKVGNRKADLPNEWSELRLKDWIKIITILNKSNVLMPMDESLSDEDKKIEEAERNERYFDACKEIFAYLTKLPSDIVGQCQEEEIVTVVSTMNNFLQNTGENGKEVAFFEHKGTKYYYPTQNMRKSTFEDFIETSQLEVLQQKKEAGRFEVVAEQMAILCREEGEKFDLDKIEKKTRKFLDVTMDKVWNFIFFLRKQTNTSMKSLQMFLKEK